MSRSRGSAKSHRTIVINDEFYPAININIGRLTSNSTIVFLGEGDFTFSTAFAASRRSWQGLRQTEFYNESQDQNSMEQLAADVADTIRWLDSSTKLAPRSVDATNMGDRKILMRKLRIPEYSAITLWFQCPWSRHYLGGQAQFLKDFLLNAAWIQHEGESLVIGICVDPQWVHRYGQIQNLCRDFYKCELADTAIVGEMIDLGYEHSDGFGGSLGLHNNDQFATILLKRNNAVAPVPFLGGLYLSLYHNHVEMFSTRIMENVHLVLNRNQWLRLAQQISNSFDLGAAADVYGNPTDSRNFFWINSFIRGYTGFRLGFESTDPENHVTVYTLRRDFVLNNFGEQAWNQWKANQMGHHVNELFNKAGNI